MSPSQTRSVVFGVTPHQPEHVVRQAAEIAVDLGAELICVQAEPARYPVLADPEGMLNSLPYDPELGEFEESEFDPELASRLEKILGKMDPALSWSRQIAVGEPGQVLIKIAKEVDARMIIVGTREEGLRAGLAQFFKGSVAMHLAHRQHRPVVIIPVAPVRHGESVPWEPGV